MNELRAELRRNSAARGGMRPHASAGAMACFEQHDARRTARQASGRCQSCGAGADYDCVSFHASRGRAAAIKRSPANSSLYLWRYPRSLFPVAAVGAFEIEQRPLTLESPAITAQRPRFTDHSMAGNDQRDGVARDRTADGA